MQAEALRRAAEPTKAPQAAPAAADAAQKAPPIPAMCDATRAWLVVMVAQVDEQTLYKYALTMYSFAQH